MSAQRTDDSLRGATIGITGASGFVGGAFVERFARDGFSVVAFARDPSAIERDARVAARRYVLGEVPDLAGVDVLVHCAYAVRASVRDDAVARNVEGTLRLARAAADRGVRFAFLSSVNAIPTIDSAYARQKRAIEAALAADVLVLRPGLVAGHGGVFAALLAAARGRIVPLLDAGRGLVQLVGIDDLYDALRIALGAHLAGAHTVVATPPMTLRALVGTIAAASGRRPLLVAVPAALVWPIAAAAERAGIVLPVTTENLRGLRGARVQAPSADLQRLGWTARDPEAVLRAIAAKTPA